MYLNSDGCFQGAASVDRVVVLRKRGRKIVRSLLFSYIDMYISIKTGLVKKNASQLGSIPIIFQSYAYRGKSHSFHIQDPELSVYQAFGIKEHNGKHRY